MITINMKTPIKKSARLRLTAVLLAAVTLLLSLSVGVTAKPDTPLEKSVDKFFKDVGFMQYHYEPWDNYIYNEKYAFQWFFGFNEVYDDFMFLANVYADTIRCKFRYGDKDWLVQLWKGSYGVMLATGGEIGIYNKPKCDPVEHYFSACEKDWIGMGFTVYNSGKELFTRPFDKYWWATGYYISYLQGFYAKPRVHCVMTAKLELKNEEMAALVANCLAEKGFRPAKSPPGHDRPERYCLRGNKVYLSWRDVTESSF